jgi:hypothetical protein
MKNVQTIYTEYFVLKIYFHFKVDKSSIIQSLLYSKRAKSKRLFSTLN